MESKSGSTVPAAAVVRVDCSVLLRPNRFRPHRASEELCSLTNPSSSVDKGSHTCVVWFNQNENATHHTPDEQMLQLGLLSREDDTTT